AIVIVDKEYATLVKWLTMMVYDDRAELTQQNIALAIISHDLAHIAHVADDIIVMRHGQILEAGPTHDILSDPSHAYTQQLLDAVSSGVSRFVLLTKDAKRSTRKTHRSQ